MWGSFLNVAAYRLIRGYNLIGPRSFCPHCTHKLSWYDTIPLLSFLLLKGRCRYCTYPISWLYPFIELLTAIIFTTLLVRIPSSYWLGYGIFFSALIITIRTDIETMLISRYVTLFLIPMGWLLAVFGLLPISLMQSVYGTLLGYFFLFFIAKTYFLYAKQEGMGQGDIELLAFIGAFTGIFGCWATLIIASVLGSCWAWVLMLYFKQGKKVKIPFGPFLAGGAILFVLFQHYFLSFLT